jgi:hypothetical protein
MSDTWVKTDTGTHVRLGAYRAMYAAQSGSNWHLWLDLNDGSAQVSLNGTFTSESEAEEAARRILHGIDPATFA